MRSEAVSTASAYSKSRFASTWVALAEELL
jgi:hypothetical protein